MTEYWERSIVRGTGEEGKYAEETVLHRRGANVLQLAIRRNKALAGCRVFIVETAEAFQLQREDPEQRRKYADIPKSGTGVEWDW